MKIEIKEYSNTPKVLEQIIDIDKTFYKNFDYNDISWYTERYNETNSVHALVINKKIVGYFCIYKISKKLFKDILNLKYDNDYNFPLKEIFKKTNYHYMSSILVLEKYRRYSFLLIRRLQKIVNSLDNLVVITVSKEGKMLAEKMLKYIGKSNNAIIFAKTKED